MTATWVFAALYLWESLFFPSRLSFFQSKKETDADENLERVFTMHSRLPKWQREWQPCERTFCNLHFPRSRSQIKGIPQGADHVRGFTASGVFVDEAAFIEGLDQTIAAVRPALGKTGRLTIISSASPGIFKGLTFDEAGI